VRLGGRGRSGRAGSDTTQRNWKKLADHPAAHAEGLDRTERMEGIANRRDVPRSPGAAHRSEDQPGAVGPARSLDALLPARRAVQRGGRSAPRRGGLGAARRTADGGEPARQRGSLAAAASTSGLAPEGEAAAP